jgi:hypothetical protein
MSGSELNNPNSYPNIIVTVPSSDTALTVTTSTINSDILDPTLYPTLNVNVTSEYPVLKILTSPPIIIGSGSGSSSFAPGGVGPPGANGATGATGVTGAVGRTGDGYTGAFISGSTLYMTPVVAGVEQSAVAIGTVSGSGSELTWTNGNPVTATIGGIDSGDYIGIGSKALQILELMFYPYQPVSFSAFSVNLVGGIKELGQGITGSTVNTTWTASGPTYNWIPNGITLTSDQGTGLVVGNLNYNSTPSVTHQLYVYNVPTILTFTLTGDQLEGANVSRTESYYWQHKVYYGSSTNPAITGFTDLTGEFATNTPTNARNIVGDESTPKYFYFVIPSSFDSYTGFKNSLTLLSIFFNAAQTISVSNAYGVSTSYKYYRSLDTSVGTLNILPSTTI